MYFPGKTRPFEPERRFGYDFQQMVFGIAWNAIEPSLLCNSLVYDTLQISKEKKTERLLLFPVPTFDDNIIKQLDFTTSNDRNVRFSTGLWMREADMRTDENPDKDRITRLSLKKSSKIAFSFLVFGVAWILISDNISIRLFSNVQDVVQFAIIKGLAYVLLSTLLIFYLSYSNIKQIIRKSMIELRDKQHIEEQRYLLKALTDATSDLVFYKDAEYRYMGCNKAFEAFVERTEADIIGKTDYDLFDTGSADLFRQIDIEIINSKQSRKNEELVKYPDGRSVWLDTNKSPFFGSNHSLIGLVGISRDISLRKSLILQLEKEKKQFETFINSSHDLIFLKDDQYRHLIANQALAEFYGKEISALIGKTDHELMSEGNADACRRSDQAAVRARTTISTLEKVNDRIFETRKFPVAIDLDRMGVGAIIRDNTTEYRQQEIISHIAQTNRIIAECMTKAFANVQEQLNYALHEALQLTESQYGYIYLFDENTKAFSLNFWTNGAYHDCSVADERTQNELVKTRLWEEAAHTLRPVIVNRYNAPESIRNDDPKDQIAIHRFMSLPILENDKMVAVVSFANKATDYSDNDVQTMTLLMSGVWIAARKMEKEAETQRLLKRTQSMIDNHQAVMFLVEPLTGKLIGANKAATDFYGYTQDELLHMTIRDINKLSQEKIRSLHRKVLEGTQRYFTLPHHLKSGEIRIVDVYSSLIEYDDQEVLFYIIFDVTKREETARQNEYMAYHDYLTGLFNRRYFEEEFQRRVKNKDLPIGIFLGDVDGFKVYNDTYGHAAGDDVLRRISENLSALVGRDGVLARIGGDEFAVVVSGKDKLKMRKYLDMLNHEYESASDDLTSNGLPTISWGYALQKKKDDTLDSLEEEAEAFMYNRKFYSHHSLRSKTVNAIMETLFAKSEREKNHSERVGLLSESIAKHMHLSNVEIDKIRVAGFLHDIGKIGIDEAILNKAGKLDANEYEIIKLHPAKSAGILDKTHEYQKISDIVLSHHERYDGQGYPRKLQGEDIPLQARIIAVADTYDAITNDRPYRKAMDKAAAIEELKRSAGTQLDPEIVSVFVSKVLDEAQ